mmetsp:Transcript_3104/g.2582  ORF Transcript_3104/g.2582 Transcript_3104/m.2582 type:complete len:222 (+) Transcript_3104:223-888(+)
MRSGKKCIEDNVVNSNAEYYGNIFHDNYLHYLGNIECGNVKTNLNQTEFTAEQLKEYKENMDQFLETKPGTDFKYFSNLVTASFNEIWEINKESRFTFNCAIKILIRDNLILIVGGLFGIIFLTYTISSLILNCINKYKAGKIYKSIECDLRKQAEGGDSSYEEGLTIPEIVRRYKKARSEADFEKNILPHLENYRKISKRVVVFSKTENARQVNLWQYKK